MGTHEVPVFAVESFVEKPNLQRAEDFFPEPFYFWNSGMLLWKVSTYSVLR
ncbi:hypothetical protein L0244_01585 [bacterium]|nr:hypothetical protein [bacterium]